MSGAGVLGDRHVIRFGFALARRADRCRYSNGRTRRSFGRPADSLDWITSARSATTTSTSPTRSAMGVDRKLRVSAGEAGRMEGDVELAVGADQVPHLGCRQRGGIMAEWQPFRHRLGPDPRAEVGEGLRQPGQILLVRVRGEIDISGRWYRGLLCNRGESADDDVANLVPVQRSHYGCRVQGWTIGPSWLLTPHHRRHRVAPCLKLAVAMIPLGLGPARLQPGQYLVVRIIGGQVQAEVESRGAQQPEQRS